VAGAAPMPDLVVVVPSRGRPAAIGELIGACMATCTGRTRGVVAVDRDDPALPEYERVVQAAGGPTAGVTLHVGPGGSMVAALNAAAMAVLDGPSRPYALAFLGDDHRPRTRGWDQAYVDALRGLRSGLVYGDDGLQGEALPTQVAMTTDIVAALGWMAPPTLTHLAVDNWWLALGQRAGCIRYLPGVVVEHLHPYAGKGEWDEGYRRVNAPEMYRRDLAEFQRLATQVLPAAVAAVSALRRMVPA
jgi:hypothetical protein